MPVANLNLKDLYDTTVEFFALRSPSFSFRGLPAEEEGKEESIATPVKNPVAKLQRDCASLREKLDQAERRHTRACTCHQDPSTSSTPCFLHMRRDLDYTKNELAKSRGEVFKLEERCRLLEKTLQSTQDLVRLRDSEIERLKQALDEERSRKEKRHSDSSQRSFIGDLSPSRNGFTNPARHSWADLRAMNAFEDERRAQARSFETFLTKTDSWSGAQVIDAVKDLNAEILQFAASATDLCTFDKRPRSTPSRPTQALPDTAERLGPQFTRILATRDHTQDPILVQMALQGCIATCIKRAWSSFCIGFQPKLDIILSQVYVDMYKAEPQPTSSKWRSLAHRHIHTLHPTLAEFIVNDLAETILRWSLDVFIVSGCILFDSSPFTRDSIRSRFRDQVARITRSLVKLERVSREEIMSTNFDIVSVDPTDAFDPTTMSDAFGEYTSSRGTLLCTMELGLKCTTRRSVGSPNGEKQEVTYERRILLLPRVVLESVLNVIDTR
jgi:hypothetical protein